MVGGPSHTRFTVSCEYCSASKSRTAKTHRNDHSTTGVCGDCREERCIHCGSTDVKTALLRSKGKCHDCGKTWDTSGGLVLPGKGSGGSSSSSTAHCDDCGAPIDRPGAFCKSCARRNRRSGGKK